MPIHRTRSLLRSLAPIACLAGIVGTVGLASGCSSKAGDEGPVRSCSGSPVIASDATEPYIGDFKSGTDYLQVWDGRRYVPIFLKGMNLGRGIPGAFPGDFAIKHDDYLRWFEQMGQMGINVLRVYSLHAPAFYDALAEFNCANPDKVIYLMQGVGLPNDPELGNEELLDLHHATAGFDELIDEAIDCIHGNATLPERKRRPKGEFKTDVSRWTIGMLIGREIVSDEVAATDRIHADETSFHSASLDLAHGNPTSVWVTARLAHTIEYEQNKYGVTRPAGFSNWLETDPLRHRTEGSRSRKDTTTIDTSAVTTPGAPAGLFASFHVYPYYPDFMSEDPDYQAFASDEYGSNSYRGYLHELRAYHEGKQPVIVGEFGVPTSWGNAHFSSNGMHHGGHSEEMQAKFTKRMVESIYGEKLAGAVYFAWMDEWFKSCWITKDLAYPADHYPKWHDLANPQQAYGVLAYDLGKPKYDAFPKTDGPGRVKTIETFADAEFYWVRLTLTKPLEDGESFTMGYDTYRDDLGESLLPDGSRTKRRNEFALAVTAPATANLRVAKPYDMYGFQVKMSYSHQQSIASDIGAWVDIKRSTSNPHGSDDGLFTFAGLDHVYGKLVARRASTPASSLDAVVIDGPTVEIRVPWTMIQVADPTTFSVVHDDPKTPEFESEVTEGIAVSVAIDGEILETNRRIWPTWRGAPKYTERYKPAAQALAESFAKIPANMLGQ